MKIDKALISKLETLARLRLSPQEKERIQADLTNILNMVQQLEQLDTTGVAPLLHLHTDPAPLRPDEIRDQLSNEQALHNAPDPEAPYFRVPKVIRKPS